MPILSYSQLSATTIINNLTTALGGNQLGSGVVTNDTPHNARTFSSSYLSPTDIQTGIQIVFQTGALKGLSRTIEEVINNGTYTEFITSVDPAYTFNDWPTGPAVGDKFLVFASPVNFAAVRKGGEVGSSKTTLKSLILADTERSFNEDERSTDSAPFVMLKRMQLNIPPMPGVAVLMSTAYGFKVKWQDKYETGGSGNTEVVLRDSAGVIQLTSAPHAIAADVYGDQSETVYQNAVAAYSQPMTIEIWGQSTTGGDHIYVQNMELCYDIQESLPVVVNDP
jgi:hypothetical protein